MSVSHTSSQNAIKVHLKPPLHPTSQSTTAATVSMFATSTIGATTAATTSSSSSYSPKAVISTTHSMFTSHSSSAITSSTMPPPLTPIRGPTPTSSPARSPRTQHVHATSPHFASTASSPIGTPHSSSPRTQYSLATSPHLAAIASSSIGTSLASASSSLTTISQLSQAYQEDTRSRRSPPSPSSFKSFDPSKWPAMAKNALSGEHTHEYQSLLMSIHTPYDWNSPIKSADFYEFLRINREAIDAIVKALFSSKSYSMPLQLLLRQCIYLAVPQEHLFGLPLNRQNFDTFIQEIQDKKVLYGHRVLLNFLANYPAYYSTDYNLIIKMLRIVSERYIYFGESIVRYDFTSQATQTVGQAIQALHKLIEAMPVQHRQLPGLEEAVYAAALLGIDDGQIGLNKYPNFEEGLKNVALIDHVASYDKLVALLNICSRYHSCFKQDTMIHYLRELSHLFNSTVISSSQREAFRKLNLGVLVAMRVLLLQPNVLNATLATDVEGWCSAFQIASSSSSSS